MFNNSLLTWTVQVDPGPEVLISRKHGKTLMVPNTLLLWLKTLMFCKQSVLNTVSLLTWESCTLHKFLPAGRPS